ncbi:unnamed protein product [Fraxinus pennsylvanica]|uniref:Uncharacterized protein n=1 Tax=Fraxinus pennsylvanica TaxID=56036 RepID=A0AAD1Z3M2_9LAMI|nr:unnamed protein product [Fraxinus pennsylvanica]
MKRQMPRALRYITLIVAAEITIQLAAEKFIQSSSQCSDELSLLNHPYPSSMLGNSAGDSEEVHLLQNLLSSAEKIEFEEKDCGSFRSIAAFRFDPYCISRSDSSLSLITKLAGIQTLFEHVAEARKVHIIDLEISVHFDGYD